MSSFTKLLKQDVISVEMMNVKFLKVPVQGYKNRVIHARGVSCPNFALEVKDKKERAFYSDADIIGSELEFEYITFNDFLNNQSKYCDACLSLTRVGSGDDLLMREFVPFLQKAEKLLTDDSFYNSSSFNLHAKWFFVNNIFKIKSALDNCFEYDAFVEKLLQKLSSLEYADVAAFKNNEVNIINYLTVSAIPDFRVESSVSVKETLNNSRESFKQALQADETFVIFDFNFEWVEDFDVYDLEYEGELLLKIMLYPTFTFGSFSVLPQSYYLWLDKFFDAKFDYSVFNEAQKMIVSSIPSKETLETMKGLFQEGDNALNSYEKVYTISRSI